MRNLRNRLSIVKEAKALSDLSQMAQPKLTAAAIAGQLGFHVDRVRRLLRLHEAPDIIKNACNEETGAEVSPNEEDDPQNPGTVRRGLDLLAALEFARIRQHYAQTLSADEADRKTLELIEKALRDDWGLRRIQALRVEVARGAPARRPTARSRGSRRHIYRQRRNKLFVDGSRLAQLSPRDRRALRATLSKLIDKLDRLDSASCSESDAIGPAGDGANQNTESFGALR